MPAHPTPAAAERAALCDLFDEVGPDAPTRSGDWTTRDLAAHLVVRERRPDAAAGIVAPFLSGYSEKVRRLEMERPYAEIVERVRKGPPLWSPMRAPAVDRLANTIEFFVHHEDVRRGGPRWTSRQLDPQLTATLDSLIGRLGRLMTRRLPVGLAIEPEGSTGTRLLHKGPDTVSLTGPIGEIVLFLYGRGAVADVELDGPDGAVATVRATAFGF